MKIHRLEMNVEVNMGYSDDSTLPVIPNRESQLNDSASNQNTKYKPTTRPPWHVLGACPKNQGGRLTGRSQQLNKLEWPELQRNAQKQKHRVQAGDQEVVPSRHTESWAVGSEGVETDNKDVKADRGVETVEAGGKDVEADRGVETVVACDRNLQVGQEVGRAE
ncbi:hypothetical protein ILYODFUR_034212 [Ilyodon furcidens]|uniref:Uncharacterized protein n=1 Tax=Ilyodon furcidens TaxID=33524 RepID=A0ABV0VK35_9TELE